MITFSDYEMPVVRQPSNFERVLAAVYFEFRRDDQYTWQITMLGR